ncbi:MAG: MBL fold metallo-hydrolase [Anditalea sp.]
MKIEQFEDKGLAQYSYAVLSEGAREVVLIDPARDPKPYYRFAKNSNSKIVGVVLTHSHADFVSSHAEIQRKTGARIFVSTHMGASFDHEKIEKGLVISFGKIKLKALYTPGHSFDSISVLLEHDGKDKAIFTGDTLFIGDVGRPDLRGNGENTENMRRALAKEMYYSIHNKLKKLSEDIVVYPGHGAGTLCGKSLSTDSSSTMGREFKENHALQDRSEEDFIEILLENQPFIPPYFSYDVALNKTGAKDLETSLKEISSLKHEDDLGDAIIIDTRQEKEFKKGHLSGAINIQNGEKFETWLGTIVSPDQQFFLIAKDNSELDGVIRKAAKIGYEANIKGALVKGFFGHKESQTFNVSDFKNNPSQYTVVDIRNIEETANEKLFENSINISLPELQKKMKKIPTDKPVVVHCAGGYRSAIGSSILEKEFPQTKVYDLSEAVKEFQGTKA